MRFEKYLMNLMFFALIKFYGWADLFLPFQVKVINNFTFHDSAKYDLFYTFKKRLLTT